MVDEVEPTEKQKLASHQEKLDIQAGQPAHTAPNGTSLETIGIKKASDQPESGGKQAPEGSE